MRTNRSVTASFNDAAELKQRAPGVHERGRISHRVSKDAAELKSGDLHHGRRIRRHHRVFRDAAELKRASGREDTQGDEVTASSTTRPNGSRYSLPSRSRIVFVSPRRQRRGRIEAGTDT